MTRYPLPHAERGGAGRVVFYQGVPPENGDSDPGGQFYGFTIKPDVLYAQK